MKFSENWLRQWINPPIDTEALAHQLTMAGLEVDSTMPASEKFTFVVIGQIQQASPHPNADRLQICTVDIGDEKPLSIVCGAKNARAGIKVAVALIGAILPSGLKIKKTKLRGESSEGMLCAGNELGFPDKEEGILELSQEAPLGLALKDYLALDDQIIDIDLTPNRGDCFSIKGIAREVAALNNLELNVQAITAVPPTFKETFPVIVSEEADCPRYAGRIIKNINASAHTPVWMQEALRRGGIRSIHPVVDVTNYVMLEQGQPLHAFDLEILKGKITVRKAKEKETITLLDGQTLSLNDNTLVIADDDKAQAIAGIMGGNSSGVTEKTQHLFLESAFFDPLSIRKSVQHYKLHTDSSHRFERGVDHTLQIDALERATQLLLDIVGGEASEIQLNESKKMLPPTIMLSLRKKQITRVLGKTIPDNEVESMMNRLGIVLDSKKSDAWQFIIPAHRFDLNMEIDLIEEIARMHGYDNIPCEKMQTHAGIKTDTLKQNTLRVMRQLLVNQGYFETINYSFISMEQNEWLGTEAKETITLANPISMDLSIMRSNLWAGLLKALLYNQNRQQERIRLFETGLCFTKKEGEYTQIPKIAGIATGEAYPKQWGEKSRLFDFFDMKGDIENLFQFLDIKMVLSKNCHAMLHPAQAAEISLNNEPIGHLGALHPKLANTLKLKQPVYLFELNLSPFEKIVSKKVFNPLSKFPLVRRDLSFILDKTMHWEDLKRKINDVINKHLYNIRLFDIYIDKSIGENKKSVALSLTFQSFERTLIEEEINEQIEQLIVFLKNEMNITLRE